MVINIVSILLRVTLELAGSVECYKQSFLVACISLLLFIIILLHLHPALTRLRLSTLQKSVNIGLKLVSSTEQHNVVTFNLK